MAAMKRGVSCATICDGAILNESVRRQQLFTRSGERSHQVMGQISSGRLVTLFVVSVFCVAFAQIVAPCEASAYDDPGVTYKTIETPHFEIHYQEQAHALAMRTAVLAEEAHTIYVPLLGWTPATKTQVFINDRLDVANGSATTYARNTMNIYGMPPESDSVLGYYEDWLRVLVYHEYVHVLHLDTTLGIAPYVNSVIGKILNPNQLMPRWYVEGLATFQESARTGAGRVNSSLYQMWLRAEVLDPDTATFGQVSHSPVRWPFGSIAYLFGGFFMAWIAERHGEDFFVKFHREYGATLIPFGLNRIARDIAGEDFDQMWTLWTTELTAQSIAGVVANHARGMETRIDFLTTSGGENKYPRWRPGHDELSFFQDDMRSHQKFSALSQRAMRAEEEYPSPHKLFEVDQAAMSSNWSPDGEVLIYGRKKITKNVYRYNDLFTYDMRTKQERRLTTLDRAREAVFSPDGSQVAYVRHRFGTMELVLRAFDGEQFVGEEEVLLSGQWWPWDDDRHWQQIATPEFLPDGSGLVFSWWRLDLRQRDLWLYTFPEHDASGNEVASASLEPLMRDEAVDLDPCFGPDGRLYFSSDRTGVYNIYAMDLEDRSVEQLSDVVMGAFMPRPSPDGEWIAIVTYSFRGYDIARIRHPGKEGARPAPQSKSTMGWRRYPKIDVTTFEEEPYRPWRYLKPLIFIPDAGVMTSGSGIAASVTGFEPTNRHFYTATAGIVSDPQFNRIRPNLGLLYRYEGLPFTLSLNSVYKEFPELRSLIAESRYFPFIERQILSQANIAYPLLSTLDSWTLTGSYNVDHRSYGYVPTIRHEPGDLEPVPAEIGWFNQLNLSLSYNYLERYPYSISTERGIGLLGSVAVRHPVLGSDYQSLTMTYSAQGYLPLPWLDRHVLAATVTGGYITSNFRDQSFFTMGGNSLQNLFQSAVFQGSSSTLVVRGYPAAVQSGSKYLVSSLQWRFPLLDLERGFSTTPLYFRQLKGRLFLDYGAAYNGFLTDSEPLVGVGGEAVMTAIFGYYLSGNLRLGYARGLVGEEAIHDVYFLYGGGF